MKIYTVCINKVIGTGILAVCILAAGIYATIQVSYNMGYNNGMNKILEEHEVANQTAHTDWADFGGGYYTIGAEIVEGTETGALFELINGETYYVEKEGLNIDSVYYLTMSDNGTPEWMNDDIICAIWEAK